VPRRCVVRSCPVWANAAGWSFEPSAHVVPPEGVEDWFPRTEVVAMTEDACDRNDGDRTIISSVVALCPERKG
jgi:hypothetical protein